MSKHTQGPWTAIEFNLPIGGCTHEIQHGTDGEVVCENVYGEANAKLIAAAPELLECVLDALSDLRGHMSVGMILAFQTAIKKATE